MLSINYLNNWNQLQDETKPELLTDFLSDNLDQFGDSKTAIRKAIDYAMSEESGKGGFVITAKEDKELVGVLVMNKTGMSEYIPENLLVYIAVKKDQRGKGIGAEIIKAAMQKTGSPIALHVEYDNPAKKLYERLGFSTKYAEMRFNPQG
ncbi:MAG: GNAT family N-acetyltransferase [Candidatus Cloacimonadaceae bacterium]